MFAKKITGRFLSPILMLIVWRKRFLNLEMKYRSSNCGRRAETGK
jgi:hypothetical protein